MNGVRAFLLPLTNPATTKTFLDLMVDTDISEAFKTNTLPPPGLDGTTNDATIVFPSHNFSIGDWIRIEDEVLLVKGQTTNSVTVQRQYAGTVTQSHAGGIHIYAISLLVMWNVFGDACPQKHIADLTNQLTSALAPHSMTHVKIPVLFHAWGPMFYAGSANMVNCLVYPGHGIYMQDPGSGDFRDHVSSRVPGVVFINIWDDYHRNYGEVHCGTTTRRQLGVSLPWWTQAPNWK